MVLRVNNLGRGAVTQKVLRTSGDFEASSSQYISRNFGTATSQGKWTFAFWFKLETTSVAQYLLNAGTDANNHSAVIITSTNHIAFFDYISAAYQARVSDNASVNDTNWHHGVVRYDPTIASPSSDRVRVYTDGVLATSFEFSTYPAQDDISLVNEASVHIIGRDEPVGGSFFDGLLADVYFVDGQSLPADRFVRTQGGVLVPEHYYGSYGNNGFYLDFFDSGSLGADKSGNSNDWTVTGITQSSTVPP